MKKVEKAPKVPDSLPIVMDRGVLLKQIERHNELTMEEKIYVPDSAINPCMEAWVMATGPNVFGAIKVGDRVLVNPPSLFITHQGEQYWACSELSVYCKIESDEKGEEILQPFHKSVFVLKGNSKDIELPSGIVLVDMEMDAARVSWGTIIGVGENVENPLIKAGRRLAFYSSVDSYFRYKAQFVMNMYEVDVLMLLNDDTFISAVDRKEGTRRADLPFNNLPKHEKREPAKGNKYFYKK